MIADVDALAAAREGRAAEVETGVFVSRAPETAAERVLVLPISSGTQIVGALVAGVSRFLRLAGDYRDFFDLAAARISAAIANARAYEEERQPRRGAGRAGSRQDRRSSATSATSSARR